MDIDLELTKRSKIHGYVVIDLNTTSPIIKGTDYLECLKEQMIQTRLYPSMKISLIPVTEDTYNIAEVPTI